MASPLLIKKSLVYVKQETAQSNAATTGATDGILVEDLKIDPKFEVLERNAWRSTLDPLGPLLGRKTYDISFKTELKASGTAGTPYDPLNALIAACGFLDTDNGSTSEIYTPSSGPFSANYFGPGKSCTIEVNIDGVFHQAIGCMGDMDLELVAGKTCFAIFKMQGLYAAPSDAAFTTFTPLAQKPAVFESATFTCQSFAAVIEKLTISCGNVVVQRPSANSVGGIAGFMVTDRKPKITIDPEMTKIATHNWHSLATTYAQGVLSAVLGASAGNIITLSCPKAQYTDLKYNNRGGFWTIDPTVHPAPNAGDDWLTITMT